MIEKTEKGVLGKRREEKEEKRDPIRSYTRNADIDGKKIRVC